MFPLVIGSQVSSVGERVRLALTRLLARMGLGESSFLLIAAVLIAVITAAAAVAFHELINWVRDWLYVRLDAGVGLYGRGVWLLMFLPATGGLVVGLISRYVIRIREGRGIVDVLESVMRSRGVISPGIAIEKIVTSGITIGSGGSAGAEGPIVQIGAAIASGVGQLFRVARQAMPVLIGCGSAAGISAIFNSPLGGVLFTLEVILQDFSLRTFTPVVLASVIANVTTQAIYRRLAFGESYQAIFALPDWIQGQHLALGWGQVLNFMMLGLCCGLVGVALTRLTYWSEDLFHRLRFPRPLKPALGGAMLGATGVLYVMIFGWGLLERPKPFPPPAYPMPAFFGDGYGVIRQLIDADFYARSPIGPVLLLVASLIVLKIAGTCMTLSSGGSGGIIAPCLFLGAVTGSAVGILFRATGIFPNVQPEMYALVGMGAVLGAVVHAPLAGILILYDVTRDDKVMLPAMLATIVATGFARLLFHDSIYTLALRRRGVHVGGGTLGILQRTTIEQVELEPAGVVDVTQPLADLIDGVAQRGVADVIVVEDGRYAGMITAYDIQTALWAREAIPLLAVADLLRRDIPIMKTTDDLALVLDTFAKYDVGRLPVCLPSSPANVIGLISRVGLLRRYQRAAP
jgi:CIC family chloride channel protein